ncbi:MAG TPA: hypothetical protein VMB03_15810 [Bryobacteraceae bacterium]|nr:hypothetical protein [Bryobacteraceae bacterium]
MKLTRRQLAAAVCGSAVAQAQTETRAAAPADDLQTARSRLQANAEALAEHELPANTEPAFRFQA